MGYLRPISFRRAGPLTILLALFAGQISSAQQALPSPGEPFSFCERLAQTAPERIRKAEAQGEPVRGLALDVAACLGHADPEIRDGFAYATLAGLLRMDAVPDVERHELLQTLLTNMNSYVEDPNGFLKPFSILVLSEVARSDRLRPWMSRDERKALLETGTAYLEAVRDYRGFDDEEGWRHGVAHAADLLLQLSLNEAVGREEGDRILAAIATQIASDNAPAYIFDEPRRLARPMLALVSRDLYTEAALTAWFEAISQPAPLESWEEAFASESALARRHNLRMFGYVVLAAANEGGEGDPLRALRPGALHLLSVIP